MKKIPFLDLKALHDSIDGEIRGAIDAVLAHGRFINGSEITDFEKAWAVYTGAAAAVGASNGTTALHAILACLGIGPGDEVIIPSHTFIATAESVRLTGATPVFADIDVETWTLDPADVEKRLSPRTRAIIPVHIYGAPANTEALNAIACAHNVYTIEDAAQGHGATLNGKTVGSLGFAAAFSFFPGKNLGAFGDAGAVTTIDEEFARKVRLYVNHGREDKYEHLVMGTNYRLDTIQAAILSAKLPHLNAWTTNRRRAAALYRQLLAGEPFASAGVRFQRLLPNAESAYHLFVVSLPRRDAVQAHLQANGVGTGIHYPIPCHQQPAMKDFHNGSLPVTEQLAPSILSLPMCPMMSEDDVREVCARLAIALEETK